MCGKGAVSVATVLNGWSRDQGLKECLCCQENTLCVCLGHI